MGRRPANMRPVVPTPLARWMAFAPRMRTGRWVARALNVTTAEVSRWKTDPAHGGRTPSRAWRERIDKWTRGAVPSDGWLVKVDAEDAQG